MELKFDKEQLLLYLKSFYTLTHMRIVLFDNQSKEICSYPEEDSPFCKIVQNGLCLKEKCMESNRLSFAECKKNSRIAIYHCHASLVEATAVLKNRGVVLGYVMIGQSSDIKDKDERFQTMKKFFAQRNIDMEKYKKEIQAIRYKNDEQFKSAALILEALINYLSQENYISMNKNQFVQEINEYIERHLAKKIEVDDLCKRFGYGRTKLYELANMSLHMSVSRYITLIKMEKAKTLLLDNRFKIVDVADMVGYSDLNYFSKAFKKMIGFTPSDYRKKNA